MDSLQQIFKTWISSTQLFQQFMEQKVIAGAKKKS